jgi:hypothetical protein
MDRLTAEIGITLPDEARTWWGWHDGAGEPGAGYGQRAAELGPGMYFLPLSDAVAHHREMRTLSPDVDPDDLWPANWLAVSALDDQAIVLYCDVAKAAPVPVEWYITEAGLDNGPNLLSMGEMVAIWTGAIDCGGWWFEYENQRWECDWERLPPDLRVAGISG